MRISDPFVGPKLNAVACLPNAHATGQKTEVEHLWKIAQYVLLNRLYRLNVEAYLAPAGGNYPFHIRVFGPNDVPQKVIVRAINLQNSTQSLSGFEKAFDIAVIVVFSPEEPSPRFLMLRKSEFCANDGQILTRLRVASKKRKSNCSTLLPWTQHYENRWDLFTGREHASPLPRLDNQGRMAESIVLTHLLLRNAEAYAAIVHRNLPFDISLVRRDLGMSRIEVKSTDLRNNSTSNIANLRKTYDYLVVVAVTEDEEICIVMSKRQVMDEMKNRLTLPVSRTDKVKGCSVIRDELMKYKDRWDTILD